MPYQADLKTKLLFLQLHAQIRLYLTPHAFRYLTIIPKYSEHNVSHGDTVLAMILNGLGFHSRTLHMFSDFFETKPASKLFAKDIKHIILPMMH